MLFEFRIASGGLDIVMRRHDHYGEPGARRLRLGGRFGGALVDVLKRQHSGVLSLYVSWCLFGAVIIVAYLMAAI